MRSDGLFKILGVGFLLALLLYIASFALIQNRREHNGPWQVVFLSDHAGTPSLLVSQTNIGIAQHRITFAGQKAPKSNMARAIYFDGPTTNVPFGTVIFQDPTFLPGTVTFNFWGHEVELLPRTLVIDRKEVPWQSQTNFVVSGAGRFEAKPVMHKPTKAPGQ